MNGPDKALIGANAVLVAVSMCLTSFFGWTLGEGILWLAVVLAVAGATISFLAPLMGKYASLYATKGFYFPALMCAVVAGGFFLVDVLSNFGAAAAVRSMNVIAAQNVNDAARDARQNVTDLEKALADVQESAAWSRTDLETPATYLAKIELLKSEIDKRGRNLYKRSGECGTDGSGVVVTETDSKALCQNIASLRAEHAMATERKFLEAKAVELQVELTKARGRAAETPTVASAAIAQVKMLSRFLTLDLEPGEAAKAWTDQGIVAAFSIAVSVGAFVTALVIGIRQGLPTDHGRRSHYANPRENPYWRDGYVPDMRDADQHEFERVSARTFDPHAPAGQQGDVNVVVAGGPDINVPDKLKEAMNRVNASLAQYQMKIPTA